MYLKEEQQHHEVDNHTGRQFSFAFKFRYFVNEKFAKFKFRLFLNFLKSLNDSLYDWNSKIKIW